MKNIIERYWLMSVLSIVSVVGIFVRLSIETDAIKVAEIWTLQSSQTTYPTKLKINSDVESVNFISKVVATDLILQKRVIVIGSTQTNGLLSGLKFGDVIHATGFLSSLNEFERYRKYEHIVGVFQLESVQDMNPSNSKLNLATQALRDAVVSGCSRLGADERGVCEGLLIGKRNHIDRELYGTYKKAQLTHLLVASGANIAFLVGFIMPIISKLGRKSKSFALISVALFYCATTRFEPSILRACVMVIIPAIFSAQGLSISRMKIFVGTVLVCGLIDPFLMFRVGFWLSLSATFGLYFVSPKLKNTIKSEIVSNTISATLCVQPVLWIAFGLQAPVRWWVSVIAIAIAEPLSTIGLFLVVLSSKLGPQSWMGHALVLPVGWGTRGLNITAEFGSSNWGYCVGWAFTLFGIIAYTYRKRANKRLQNNSKRGVIFENVDQVSVLHYR